MSYIDNDPPKQHSIGELFNDDNLSIYDVAKGKRKHKYVVALNMEEIRVLVSHGEKYFFTVNTNSKKEYLAALEIQKRARQYLEETSSNKLILFFVLLLIVLMISV